MVGLGLRRARRGLELIAASSRREERVGRASARRAAATAPAPHVALLGHFDPYLLGYASRDLVLDPRHAKRIQAGGGFIAPAVLVDGRVVGHVAACRARLARAVRAAGRDVLAALESESSDVERFCSQSPRVASRLRTSVRDK